jgi:hypothetical protein
MVETRIHVLQCLEQMDPTGGKINAYRLLNDHSEDREKEMGYNTYILFMFYSQILSLTQTIHM